MSERAIFQIHLLLGYLSWALLIRTYVWPRLKRAAARDAQGLILTFHSFRFFGLVFLLPGFVGADLPAAFAEPAAFGDLAASVLAILALLASRWRWLFWPLVVTFNTVGAGDLILDTYHAIAFNIAPNAGRLGAAYAIPILYVPGLMLTHGLSIYLLTRKLPTLDVNGPASQAEDAGSPARIY